MPDARSRAAEYREIIDSALANDWTPEQAEQLAALQVFGGMGEMAAGFQVAAGERLPELVADARQSLGLEPIAGETGILDLLQQVPPEAWHSDPAVAVAELRATLDSQELAETREHATLAASWLAAFAAALDREPNIER